MGNKPSYLGLLNAISVAEGRAHTYLRAWAEVTPSDDVRAVLLKVAAREGEHAMSFARRINELGFEVRHKGDDGTADAVALVTSECSDLEKMKRLKLHRLDTGDAPDVFDGIFADHSIDIATGELLGRYIAEERDSARLLRNCYEQLRAASASGDHSDRIPNDRIAELERTVESLCEAVAALQEAGRPAANGSRPKVRSK